ncbi:MAG: hypothetical protein U9N13_08005 [Euryarchaeota archaeon]|nr:hypothetical protein [Euryarchaeota archaeon]
MMKAIITLMVISLLFVSPASADLANDLDTAVDMYNQNVDKVPSVLKSLFGNHDIILNIEMNENFTIEQPAFVGNAASLESTGVISLVEEEGPMLSLIARTDGNATIEYFGDWSLLDENGDWPDGNTLTACAAMTVTTDEDTVRSVLESQTPATTFMNAFNRGSITVDSGSCSGISASIKMSAMRLVIRVASFFV